MVDPQSNQYEPAGNTVFIVTVFLQILRFVSGGIPPDGARVLKMRKMPVSIDDARRFVAISPNTIVEPTSAGRPAQIRSDAELKGDGIAGELATKA